MTQIFAWLFITALVYDTSGLTVVSGVTEIDPAACQQAATDLQVQLRADESTAGVTNPQSRVHCVTAEKEVPVATADLCTFTLDPALPVYDQFQSNCTTG